MGSLLFVIGSFLFLPGSTFAMAELAVSMFGVGSSCFLIATAIEPAVSAPRNFCTRCKKDIHITVTARTSDIFLASEKWRDLEAQIMQDHESIDFGGAGV